MNAAELRAELQRLRGNREIAYDCECCGVGFEWVPDERGDYVQWDDIETVLAHIERDEA